MAANTRKTGPGKPFAAGDSRINRTGRPKSFGRIVRELTNDGQELIETALGIMRGELVIKDNKVTKFGVEQVDTVANHKVRLDAVQFLAEQGWGKPAVSVELSGPEGGPMQTEAVTIETSTEHLTGLLSVLAKLGAIPEQTAALGAGGEPSAEADEVHSAPADGSADSVPSSSE